MDVKPLPAWRKTPAPVTEIAKAVGRSKCHISEVLRGKRAPGKDLARVLKRMGYAIPKGVLA